MMAMFDLINGLFEVCGAFFIMASIIRLHKDKKVKGVNWITPAFFMTWGIWNLIYYPSLEQWLSFYGGMAIALCNTIWVIQLIYYTRIQKRVNNVKNERLSQWKIWIKLFRNR